MNVEKAIKILRDTGVGTKLDYRYSAKTLNAVKKTAIQALQAQAERRWIPVSERLPDNCGMPLLLVGVNGYGQRRVFQGFTGYMKRETLLFFSNTRDVDINAWNITHWMPLPEPPKEDNDE